MITQTPYQGTIVTLWQSEIENLTYLVQEYKLKFAIELGTYKGGSALVLINAGIENLVTFDNRNLVEVSNDKAIYRVVDIFQVADEIKSLCQDPRRKILFCDNGKKSRELNLFGPHLNKGDILAAHDYPIEFKDSDVSEMITGNGYERIPLPNNDRIIAWERT